MKKKNLKYVGKAKSLYDTDDPQFLIMEFRDDTSAFDGEKKAKLARKGEINNHFNAFIMRHLEANGISTQFVDIFSKNESIVKPLDMIRVECVVRNFAAGHLCSRLGIEEGLALDPPTFEFFLKDDERHDPMVNESLIRTFKWATDEEVSIMKTQSFKINEILKPLFTEAGLLLVDFKLEFGRSDGQVVLGDEFTPDGCRIWDIQTREKMDKDRFRRDLGGVIEAYLEVAERMGVNMEYPL